MKHLPTIARILLGLLFVFGGVTGLFELVEQPEVGEEAAAFMGAIMDTGYLWPVIKVTEIVCGVLLILGMFVPLALVVLAPVALNILLFHVFLEPSGLVFGLVLLVLGLYTAHQHRESFSGVLKRRA
ncbi:MAG: DoxX family protein [Holophagales bacterium]|nr:DoxX family protein [Acidobacteriota bacterium]MYB20212.1 DoxX family protein [Holophagales bacterium]MYH25702.1 DoxX family protein [Holophagales bacterium]